MQAAQVLIAERHPLFRECLRGLVQDAVGECLVVEAADCRTALDAVRHLDLRLILLDLTIDDMEGLVGLVELTLAAPRVPVLVVSAHESGDVIRHALVCGAAGYVPKSLTRQMVTDAIRRVMAGGVFHPHHNGLGGDGRLDALTLRERAVFSLLVAGRSNKQMAFDLSVSDATIRAHMSAVLRKLGVRSRTQAVIAARRLL